MRLANESCGSTYEAKKMSQLDERPYTTIGSRSRKLFRRSHVSWPHEWEVRIKSRRDATFPQHDFSCRAMESRQASLSSSFRANEIGCEENESTRAQALTDLEGAMRRRYTVSRSLIFLASVCARHAFQHCLIPRNPRHHFLGSYVLVA